MTQVVSAAVAWPTCEERGLRFLARAAEAVLSRSLAKSQPVCALQAVPEDLGHASATLGQAGAAYLGVDSHGN